MGTPLYVRGADSVKGILRLRMTAFQALMIRSG
jgi:hypothetical protein